MWTLFNFVIRLYAKFLQIFCKGFCGMRTVIARPRSGQHLEQHLNHSCLYKLPELRPSPSWSPCRTFSSTTRHRLRFARKTGPPSPLFVAHTLCPSVWPERTQMEAHSVSAAPHNCADESESLVVTNTAELNGKGGPRCCARASFCLAFAFVVLSPPYVFPAYVVRAALDCIGRCSLSGKRSCVFLRAPSPEDLPLRCVCRSWCCESGRRHTPLITRLFHNTRVALHRCRRDEDPLQPDGAELGELSLQSYNDHLCTLKRENNDRGFVS